jgi:hypothetical protein
MSKKKYPSHLTSTGMPRRRTCAAMPEHFALMETEPTYRQKHVELEHACMANLRMAAIAPVTPFKIKVVVHVVYKTPAEKISKAQVKSQITVLNRDYRAKNPDRNKTPAVFAGLVADPMIQFVLATKDPSGQATTGITYTQTTKDSFGYAGNPVKSAATGGVDAWNTSKYLNIWVCTLGDGLLGYAQFPNGPGKTDGVVCLNTAFGTKGTATAPYNLGRSATHEVGHFLNLRHIWGDTEDCSGGDLVADTPNAETANFGKPAFPSVSCGNGPNGDLFMNYMDYTDDDSMFMFTPGQVSRMHTTLAGPRKSLVS